MENTIKEIKKFIDFIKNNSEDKKLVDYSNKVYEDILILEEKFRFDDLTGVFSRKQFEKILKKEVELTERTGKGFMFVIFDLVGLKHVNDTFSRTKGDQYIKFAANWLSKNIRDTDILGRFGDSADEFGLIGRGETLNVEKIISRLKEKLEGKKFESDIPFSFTIGGSIYSPGKNIIKVIEEAEIMLNKDKINRKKEGLKVRI